VSLILAERNRTGKEIPPRAATRKAPARKKATSKVKAGKKTARKGGKK
jgi:hypothetical protein